MFQRVLVANRGEIAVRVIRACRDLGISPVTVHSAADRDSLHVRLADASVEIGEAPSSESYLKADRVVAAATGLGAEAIHPGYGFLSENAAFASRCEAAGVVFVGPPAGAMARLGDKAAARAAAEAALVPVAPGSGVLDRLDDARRVADRLGWPLLVKAVAGGGGKGMRVVRAPDELPGAFEEARAESESSFADSRVFLERLIENPRHVEIQVFGDSQGNMAHLGERDCSIQRRNQKLVEESPSPAVDAGLREEMGAAAVRLAREGGYRNAGTVEFLLDADRNYYFLEMNTRLQVEHPVTEAVAGLDLVELQLREAAREPLPFRQSDVELRGAAIEMRITAEDPFADFLPATGRVREFRPPDGPGVRCDAGIVAGSLITSHYDPLLAKIIASGPDRESARRRALRAVSETRLTGVPSTLSFFERVLADPRFAAGDFDTSFVDSRWTTDLAAGPSPRREELLPFALAAAAAEAVRVHAPDAGAAGRGSAWREAGVRAALRSG